jgi:zinc protease
VTQTRLENGLLVVLEERHHAPFVSMHLRYATGSRDDPPSQTGLAALTLRMMTTATKHVGEGMYERWLARAGATDRTWWVSHDAAAETVTVPSTAVPLVLWMWSDQMGFFAPRADRALLDGARETAKGERRQKVDNVAYGAMRELVLRSLYPEGHPYRAAPLSIALDDVTVDDVRDCHARRFSPDGAVLVLSGDFQSAEVLEAIRRYFGPIPAAPPVVAPRFPIELERETRLAVAARVQSPVVEMTWRTPAFYDAGDAELDVVARALAGAHVALLHWALVDRSKVATAVSAHQSSRALGSDFQIRAVVAPGHTPAEVIEGIDAVLAELQTKTMADERVRAVVDELTIPRLFELDRGAQRASLLAQYAALRGDADWLTSDLARYEAVTARALSGVVARWLTPRNRVLAVVTPDASAPPSGVLRAQAAGSEGGVR